MGEIMMIDSDIMEWLCLVLIVLFLNEAYLYETQNDTYQKQTNIDKLGMFEFRQMHINNSKGNATKGHHYNNRMKNIKILNIPL